MSSVPKRIIVVAGPNGSGKTTFAKVYLDSPDAPFAYLNPDLIAQGLTQTNFDQASFQAGRILITQVKEAIRQNQSIAFESTLSGKTWLTFLRESSKNGYEVQIYFLYLKSIDKNFLRISERVKHGGHNIPKEAVLRRHSRVFENFWNQYRLLANEWIVLDNSGSSPKEVMNHNQFKKLKPVEQQFFSQYFLQGVPHDYKRRTKTTQGRTQKISKNRRART